MKGRKKELLIAAVFAICFVSATSASTSNRVDGFISQSSQKKVRFSVHIINADTGRTVYSHNAEKPLVPASNMKIITTAAALKYLGPNYEYKTKVGLSGGTLVIIGSGDPLLGDRATDAKYGRKPGWIFRDIAAALNRNGIKSIKDIVVDSSVFDDQRVNPNWPKNQLNRWYACEVSGLNYNDNCIEVTARTIKGSVELTITPTTGYVSIVNKCKPTYKRHNTVWCSRPAGTSTITVLGRCYKQSRPIRVTIERPPAFFGYLLAENLAEAGIHTEGKIIEKTMASNCDFRPLGLYRTPITDCLARCNKNSFGLAAEALLKTIAAQANKNCKNGNWTEGRRLVSYYLLGLGIDGKQFHIDDGSGLSRQNKLSANVITKVLFDVYKSSNWKLYKASLAVGGVDGTIRRYFKEQKYKSKILGKTGYIAGVRAFSGICNTPDGSFIFSILANNANGRTRAVINDIVKAIIDDN